MDQKKELKINILTLEQLLDRFVLIQDSGFIFDLQERVVVSANDLLEICIPNKNYHLWETHPDKKTCSINEVGYDTSGSYFLPCNFYDGTKESEKRVNDFLSRLLKQFGDA